MAKSGAKKKKLGQTTRNSKFGNLKIFKKFSFNRSNVAVLLVVLSLVGIYVVFRASASSVEVFPLDTTQYDIHARWPSSEERSYNGYDNDHHDYNASDLFVPAGTPVRAAKGGTIPSWGVSDKGCGGQGGLQITISTSSGYQAYYHLMPGSEKVVGGQSVKAGDPLGVIGDGSCAYGTSSHLHFQETDGRPPGCRGPGCPDSEYHNVQDGITKAFRKLPLAPKDYWTKVKQPSSKATDVGAGGAGVWLVGGDNTYKWNGSKWTELPEMGGSGANRVDVGPSRPWFTSDAGNVYAYQNGSYKQMNPAQADPDARDIGIGNGVWLTAESDGQEWLWRNTASKTSRNWDNVAGGGSANRLDVSPSGDVYKVTTAGNIWYSPSNGDWREIEPTSANLEPNGDITISSASVVMGIEDSKTVLRFGKEWISISSGGNAITVDNSGYPWKIKSGVVYKGKVPVSELLNILKAYE